MSSRDLWVDSGLSLRKEIRENISLLLCMCGGGEREKVRERHCGHMGVSQTKLEKLIKRDFCDKKQ